MEFPFSSLLKINVISRKMNLVRFVIILIVFLKSTTCQTCGQQKGSKGLIFGGHYSVKGAWPWLAALRTSKNYKFFCAGSIITKSHVLSGMKNELKIYLNY
jgi:hypothetical protein